MLCGKVGFESGGINPLRGQNNVQGACDMGCLPNVFPAYQSVALEAPREKFETAWGVKLPAKPGLTVVEMSRAAYEGKLKALYVMGENMMLSDPDLHHLEESLKKLDLFIVQDIFLTETAELAHVVLPSACFAEKGGTFTNTERRVQRVRKAVEPPGRGPHGLGDHRRSLDPHGLPHEVRQAPRDLERDPPGDAELCRHHLRAHRPPGHPVALPQHGPPGHEVPPQGPVHAGASGSLHRSSSSRPTRCPTRTTRSTSRRGACSTSTTRER